MFPRKASKWSKAGGRGTPAMHIARWLFRARGCEGALKSLGDLEVFGAPEGCPGSLVVPACKSLAFVACASSCSDPRTSKDLRGSLATSEDPGNVHADAPVACVVPSALCGHHRVGQQSFADHGALDRAPRAGDQTPKAATAATPPRLYHGLRRRCIWCAARARACLALIAGPDESAWARDGRERPSRPSPAVANARGLCTLLAKGTHASDKCNSHPDGC